jgi:hypothetical protein
MMIIGCPNSGVNANLARVGDASVAGLRSARVVRLRILEEALERYLKRVGA